MVIGRGKAAQIQSEPLLAWYLELFQEVLEQPSRRLLVIGYGFGDEHINQTIANAVDQHGLKLYVLSPSTADRLIADLRNKQPYGDKLLQGLSGHFPNSLVQMFPGTRRITEPWRELDRCFFA